MEKYVAGTKHKSHYIDIKAKESVELSGEGRHESFLQISRDGGDEDLFSEINILSAKLRYVLVTITRIMSETHV